MKLKGVEKKGKTKIGSQNIFTSSLRGALMGGGLPGDNQNK